MRQVHEKLIVGWRDRAVLLTIIVAKQAELLIVLFKRGVSSSNCELYYVAIYS